MALLLEERAILDTLYRYCHCVDTPGREREFVSLFTDDAVFDIRGNYPRARRVEGRAGVEAFIAAHRKAGQYHKHIVVNPLITISGDEAHAESSWVVMDKGPKGPIAGACGRYRDRLVKQTGRWRFKERVDEIEVIDLESLGVPAR
jgi:hypothetical protein